MLAILFTIFWVLTIYWLIGWRTRDWQYGSVPYVPGQSFFVADYMTGPAPARQVCCPS